MKFNMHVSCFVVLTFLGIQQSFAQTTEVHFNYDAAGLRVKREMFYLTPIVNNPIEKGDSLAILETESNLLLNEELDDKIFESTTDIVLFPNPFESMLNIRIVDDKFLNATITFYDEVGKTVYRQKIESKVTLIDFIGFKAAPYFMEIIDSGNHKYLYKVIKR